MDRLVEQMLVKPHEKRHANGYMNVYQKYPRYLGVNGGKTGGSSSLFLNDMFASHSHFKREI